MTEETEVAPSEATETPVVEIPAGEEEGQAESQPAEAVEAEEKADEKSESQRRRERRKAHEQRLREEAETARREAETLRKRLAAMPSQGDQPKESDYTDFSEYQAELAAYKAVKALAERDKGAVEAEAKQHDSLAEQAEAQRKQERIVAFHESREDARTRYADFEQVFDAAYIPQHVADLVIESDMPADVAYHLGKNPALARSISQMPPLAAARELGRIEAQIAMPKAKTVTSAPPPISPVTAKGTAAKDPDNMSVAEWRKAREAGWTP